MYVVTGQIQASIEQTIPVSLETTLHAVNVSSKQECHGMTKPQAK